MEQEIYLEVVGVEIHSTEKIFIVDCKNVGCYDLPGALWPDCFEMCCRFHIWR